MEKVFYIYSVIDSEIIMHIELTETAEHIDAVGHELVDMGIVGYGADIFYIEAVDMTHLLNILDEGLRSEYTKVHTVLPF